jgi:hypothetical protein
VGAYVRAAHDYFLSGNRLRDLAEVFVVSIQVIHIPENPAPLKHRIRARKYLDERVAINLRCIAKLLPGVVAYHQCGFLKGHTFKRCVIIELGRESFAESDDPVHNEGGPPFHAVATHVVLKGISPEIAGNRISIEPECLVVEENHELFVFLPEIVQIRFDLPEIVFIFLRLQRRPEVPLIYRFVFRLCASATTCL